MSSKKPPPNEGAQDEALQDGICSRPEVSRVTARSRILGEIADALQVPLATLYSARSTPVPARRADGDGGAYLDDECEALLCAYKRIHDPEARRRLLSLVQAAAEQG